LLATKIMAETIGKAFRNEKGQLMPGSNINPTGKNQFTSIVPLIQALNRGSEKYGQDFWDFVAEKCRKSDPVLIAVLKKILPDKAEYIQKVSPEEANEQLNRIRQTLNLCGN